MGGNDRIYLESVERLKLSVNVNYGWVAHENEERIVLASAFCNTGEIDYILIPINSILERVKL